MAGVTAELRAKIEPEAASSGAIMPRATIEAIVARRDAALVAHQTAYSALEGASALLADSRSSRRRQAYMIAW